MNIPHWTIGITFIPFTWKIKYEGHSSVFWFYKAITIGPFRFCVACDKDFNFECGIV